MPYISDPDLPLSCAQKSFSHQTHYRYDSTALNSSTLMGASKGSYAPSASRNITVAQALEIARDYHPGEVRDPLIVQILDAAIAQIWGKLQAAPQSYVLTREEFAVFNFFQNRFEGEAIAVAARKRYWDSLSTPVV